MNSVSKQSMDIIRKMQQNEVNESCIYANIAKFAKGEENKETLLRLSQEEQAHAAIWEKYSEIKPKPQKPKAKAYECSICGYVYEGDPLPEDFICPWCKHPASDFVPIE